MWRRPLSRLSDRSAGAVHGADDPRPRHVRASARRSSRTASCMCRSLRASAPTSSSKATPPWSTGSSGCAARPSWRPTCAPPSRWSSRPRGGGRDDRQPGLPSRPRLRAAGREARRLRRPDHRGRGLGHDGARAAAETLALDREGLGVVSAHVQNTCVKRADMACFPRQRRFVVAGMRYDWVGAKMGRRSASRASCGSTGC